MRSARLALGVAVLAALAPPLVHEAAAADTTVTAIAFTYLPGQVSIARGDTVTFLNLDVAPHNIVSRQTTKKGALLFGSDTVTAGGQTAVRGVATLKPGSYPFYCSVHPTMLGTLAVRPPGSAVFAMVPTAAVVPTPTSITTYGTSLYVTGYGAGTVSSVPVLPGGALGPATPYATGLSSPLGIAFGPDGTAYVADSHAGEGAATVGRVWALPPGGGDVSAVGQVVVDNLPNGRHNTNGLAVLGDRLYFTNGNSTDDGAAGGPPEQPLSGTILSVPLRTRGVDAASSTKAITVEARGLRNVYDIAFRPGTTHLWATSNGPDTLDPYGEDLLHSFDVRAGTVDFGFPGCVYAAGANGPQLGQNPNVAAKCNPRHRGPEALLGLHVSADGLAFAPTGGGWSGEAVIAEFGSFSGVTGHAVVGVPVVDGRAGAPAVLTPAPAPLDLAFGPPGTGLYVADFTTGSISLVLPVA